MEGEEGAPVGAEGGDELVEGDGAGGCGAGRCGIERAACGGFGRGRSGGCPTSAVIGREARSGSASLGGGGGGGGGGGEDGGGAEGEAAEGEGGGGGEESAERSAVVHRGCWRGFFFVEDLSNSGVSSGEGEFEGDR